MSVCHVLSGMAYLSTLPLARSLSTFREHLTKPGLALSVVYLSMFYCSVVY